MSFKLLKVVDEALIVSFMTYRLLSWGHALSAAELLACYEKDVKDRDDVGYKFRDLQLFTLRSPYIYHCLTATWDNQNDDHLQRYS